MLLTGGIEVDDAEEIKPVTFNNDELDFEQVKVDVRQVSNIHKMMNEGSVEEKTKLEADLYLDYTMDKLSIPREESQFKESELSEKSCVIDNIDESGPSASKSKSRSSIRDFPFNAQIENKRAINRVKTLD